MATKKKLLEAAAGTAAAAGGGLNIEDVFSVDLYLGNSSTQTITNNIDLAGEGGMVWIKSRGAGQSHHLFDTERGVHDYIRANVTNAELTNSSSLTAFNSDGFTLGSYSEVNTLYNDIYNYVAFTFRKAAGFFDCFTYTGDGTQGRTISHNLGIRPGFIAIKNLDDAQNWFCVARNNDNNAYTHNLTNSWDFGFNVTDRGDLGSWAAIANDSTINLNLGALASNAPNAANKNNKNYVCYLWGHHDGDGTFGPNGDQDVIKCGVYSGTGSAGNFVDLGFEPQWLIIKKTTAADDWVMMDISRGWSLSYPFRRLYTQTSGAEADNYTVYPANNGFILGTGGTEVNSASYSYAYIAIRRGPMGVIEDADKLRFVGQQATGSGGRDDLNLQTGFPVDFLLNTLHVSGTTNPRHTVVDRVRGFNVTSASSTQRLVTHSTDAEANSGTTLSAVVGDVDDGLYTTGNVSTAYNNNVSLALRRAPKFFGISYWSGNGSANRKIPHDLTVAPEMIWVKKRSGVESWAVYHKLEGGTHFARLQGTNAYVANSNVWNNVDATDTEFTVDTDTEVNQSGQDYIAYLFATLDGISKVGSYTGDGNASQTIDCGFSAGAKYVIIKPSSVAGDWYQFDTTKGINAVDDPFVVLNSNADKSSINEDIIDTDNSGFKVNHDAALSQQLNVSGRTYIFYAIA